jgi:hypothetical protein
VQFTREPRDLALPERDVCKFVRRRGAGELEVQDVFPITQTDGNERMLAMSS